jgi:hypothetical protein
MSLAEGFLTRSLTRVRTALDEPEINAKYGNPLIIEYLETAYADVLGDISLNSQHPLLVRYDIPLANQASEQWYDLPPIMGSLRDVQLLNTAGDVQGHLSPQHLTSPWGQTWRIDHNRLWIDKNTFSQFYSIRLFFVPLKPARLHDGSAAALTASTITLAATPTKGTLDRRPNAYAGAVVRILGAATNDLMQERIICSYNATTRVASIKPDFDPVPTATSTPVVPILYEIGTTLDQVVDMAVSLYAARTIAAIEGQENRYRALDREITRMSRRIRLNAANYDAYAGGYMSPDTASPGASDVPRSF